MQENSVEVGNWSYLIRFIQQIKGVVMIRHTKYRCEININPPRTKRMEPGEPPVKAASNETPFLKPYRVCKELTQTSFDPSFSEHSGANQPKLHSPYYTKTKGSLLDVSTSRRTYTQSPNEFFPSRQDFFQSPPQNRRMGTHLTLSSNRNNRLMDLSGNYSRNIQINECASEFSLGQQSTEGKRGSSQELQRLRKQNEQLKRLLGSDRWQCCSCKAPYAQQQTQYLRSKIYSHYGTVCRNQPRKNTSTTERFRQ